MKPFRPLFGATLLAVSLSAACASTTAGQPLTGPTSTITSSVLPTGPVTTGTTGSPGCATGGASGQTPAPAKNLALSVTAGANSWIRNPATEPFAVAAYVDGRVIVTSGSGSKAEGLPTSTVGTVGMCRMAVLLDEVAAAAELPMGEANVTDQGTTVVTVRGSDQRTHSVAVYALGLKDDQYVQDTAARQNRARLSAALSAVVAARSSVQNWTADRLRLVAATFSSSLPSHPWRGPGPLADILTKLHQDGCMVVTGQVATRLRVSLGTDVALSAWADGPAQAPTGAFTVGVLLPGQPDCP